MLIYWRFPYVGFLVLWWDSFVFSGGSFVMEYSCSSILKWLSELGIGNGDLLNFQFEDVSL